MQLGKSMQSFPKMILKDITRLRERLINLPIVRRTARNRPWKFTSCGRAYKLIQNVAHKYEIIFSKALVLQIGKRIMPPRKYKEMYTSSVGYTSFMAIGKKCLERLHIFLTPCLLHIKCMQFLSLKQISTKTNYTHSDQT